MKFIDGTLEKNLHFQWSSRTDPIEYIDPGEIIQIKVPDSSINQIKKDSKTEDLKKLDHSKIDGAVGPLYINGAKVGQGIKITFLNIEIDNFGWSAIMHDFGLLKNRFEDLLVIWEIEDGYAKVRGNFLKGLRIPVNPFLGIVGVQPKKGKYGMIPPRRFGGNMDNKLISMKNSVLILPVLRDGGLISFGDPHASQGDGEVCGTGIETSAKIEIKIELIDNYKESFPYGEWINSKVFKKYIYSTGIDKNIYKAAKLSVENMINILRNFNLSDEEAYILCSVIGDLKISEIVDEPNFVVSCTIPEEILKIF